MPLYCVIRNRHISMSSDLDLYLPIFPSFRLFCIHLLNGVRNVPAKLKFGLDPAKQTAKQDLLPSNSLGNNSQNIFNIIYLSNI